MIESYEDENIDEDKRLCIFFKQIIFLAHLTCHIVKYFTFFNHDSRSFAFLNSYHSIKH
jgi:hypothetical protein